MNIINISAYRFVDLADPVHWRDAIEASCIDHQLKGTILLGFEGINIMVAGSRQGLDGFADWLESHAEFAGMTLKESVSTFVPYSKLKVRVKNEIIAMRAEGIDPVRDPAPHLSAAEFKQWLDEHRDITILDTRNRFEVDAGAFDNALDLNIESFRHFPKAAAEQLPNELKNKPLVMMCTGGIRCEKAAIELHKQGFKEVYQLDGGIIQYFQECGGAHYHGNCVVFDDRIALTPDLQPIQTIGN